jgi:hypothetical protein
VTWVDPGNFLDHYRTLEPTARARDVLLEEPTGDVYWLSEYATAQGAVKFHCGLILHFADAGTGTTIEVYEKVPTIWVGEHWAFAMHGVGFGRFHAIRFAEPTVRDRIQTLDLIDRLVEGDSRETR